MQYQISGSKRASMPKSFSPLVSNDCVSHMCICDARVIFKSFSCQIDYETYSGFWIKRLHPHMCIGGTKVVSSAYIYQSDLKRLLTGESNDYSPTHTSCEWRFSQQRASGYLLMKHMKLLFHTQQSARILNARACWVSLPPLALLVIASRR